MKLKIKKVVYILTFIFLLFLLIFLVNIVYASFSNKLFLDNYIENIANRFKKNEFSVDKIVFFSSCTSDSTINSNSTTTINNLLQYTDIAIFINNSTDNFTAANTLKSVSISDISFNTNPSLGTPNLYYKNLNSFATPTVISDNVLKTDLVFEVSSEDEIDYNKPILFNNCANPITLSYVNSNIKDDYTISSTDNSITYDGSLLKKCNVLLNDINCSFSFIINIENNIGQQFKCPVYIDIPLSNDSTSIYDGSYTYIYNPDYDFFLYE